MLQNMMSLGFFQFLFPFLLALAIFFGVIKFAAADRFPNSAAGLISLILAFFVMLFASQNPGIVGFFQNISGAGLIVATGLLFIVILLGVVGFKIQDVFKEGTHWRWAIVLVIIAIGIVIFFGAGPGFILPGFNVSSDWWTIIFFMFIMIIVLWFLSQGDKQGGGQGGGRTAPQ